MKKQQVIKIYHKGQKRLMLIKEVKDDILRLLEITSKKDSENKGYIKINKTKENNFKYSTNIDCQNIYTASKDIKIYPTNINISDNVFNKILEKVLYFKNNNELNIYDIDKLFEEQDEYINIVNNIENILKNYEQNPGLMAEYIMFRSKFYNFSDRNVILIKFQNPYSTFVASYKGWQDIGYKVIKGQKAIRILRPIENIFFMRDDEKIEIKKATRDEIVLIEKGEIKTIKETSFVRYSVFDISQTDCPKEDYPKIYSKGYASTSHLEMYNKLSKYISNLGFTILEKELTSISLCVYYDKFTDEIVLNTNLEDSQKLSTLLHEVSHAIMHKTIKEDKAIKELEAEMLACSLLHKFGFELEDSNKLYIKKYYEKVKDISENDISFYFRKIKKAYDFFIENFEKYMLVNNISIEITNKKEQNEDKKLINENFMLQI